ncbi:ATP-binding cassette domain-containing protein [Desulfovibrio legallii]|uniref:ATP-binding cassette domain-containing protein n=1 Tax=Desulfovibrio legallii TaxID=571438 RepID=UPI000A5A9FDD|nr:ATP-binding cassette domain-containing protein [Desulfovibrio legallii]
MRKPPAGRQQAPFEERYVQHEGSSAHAQALPRTDAAMAQECPLRKELRLEDVSFRYPNTAEGKPDALRHLHIRIPRGSMVGFVGPSGAGKSTIVGLLTGLSPPPMGRCWWTARYGRRPARGLDPR